MATYSNWPSNGRAASTTPSATEIIEHIAHRPNFRHNLSRFTECHAPSVFEAVQFKCNSDGHIFLLDGEECKMLAGRAGLKVEQIEVVTNPLTHGHVKLGHLLRFLPASLVWSIEQATRKLPHLLHEKIRWQMVAILRKPDQA